MLENDEIAGRQKRCDDAQLRPDRHYERFPPKPEREGTVMKVFRSSKPYAPKGRMLRKFQDRKNAVKRATTNIEWEDAMIELITFAKANGDKIMADIRAGIEHEADECAVAKS
jgi:hypothetical protein